MQFKSCFVGCIYSVLAAVDLNLRYIFNTEENGSAGRRKCEGKRGETTGASVLGHSLGLLWKDGGWEKEGRAHPSPNEKRELAAPPPLCESVSWTLSLGLPLLLPAIPLVGWAGPGGFGGLKPAPRSSESGCSSVPAAWRVAEGGLSLSELSAKKDNHISPRSCGHMGGHRLWPRGTLSRAQAVAQAASSRAWLCG